MEPSTLITADMKLIKNINNNLPKWNWTTFPTEFCKFTQNPTIQIVKAPVYH